MMVRTPDEEDEKRSHSAEFDFRQQQRFIGPYLGPPAGSMSQDFHSHIRVQKGLADAAAVGRTDIGAVAAVRIVLERALY
jgi:hypothetical protein